MCHKTKENTYLKKLHFILHSWLLIPWFPRVRQLIQQSVQLFNIPGDI